jgi:hypothetical protein
MVTLRARHQRLEVMMALAVLASSFVISSASSASVGAAQKADITTTTSTVPGPATSAPTPGIENDWSYWWLPTTPQLGPAVDNSPGRHNAQPALRWFFNTYTPTNPRQITPPGSPFRTDGIVDIATSISGYYEITFSAHSMIRGSERQPPTWAFEGPSYQPGKQPEFPQCVAPSVAVGDTNQRYFEASTTCVAKLTANYPYDWYLTTPVSVELQLPYASTLPVATLMIQLLTPTT